MQHAGYVVEHEDEEHYRIKHPDGSNFRIAKGALSDETHAMIKGLPRLMAEGGIVEDSSDEDSEEESDSEPQEKESDSLSGAQKTLSKMSQKAVNPAQGGPEAPLDQATRQLAEMGAGDEDHQEEEEKEATQNPRKPAHSANAEDLQQQVDLYKKLHNDPSLSPAQNDQKAMDFAVGQRQMIEQQNAAKQARRDSAARRDQEATESYNQNAAQYGLSPKPVPEVMGPPAPVTQMDFSDTPTEIQGQATPAQYSPQASQNDPGGGLKQGIEDLGQAHLDAKQAMADAYKNTADHIQGLMDKHDSLVKQQKQELGDFLTAYQTQAIDPNRVWNKADTGSKILAGIGVLLSGIGSGLSGQQNLAIQAIEKSIDRDIAAQKGDNSSKMNLYKLMLNKFRDQNQAEIMTKAYSLGILQANLQAEAQRSQIPIIQQQAQLQSKILDAQISELQRQNAIWQIQMEAASGVPQKMVSPLLGEKQAGLMMRDPITGNYQQANSKYDYEQLQPKLVFYQPILSKLRRLKEIGNTAPGTKADAEAQGLTQQLIGDLNAFNKFGALTEGHRHLTKELFDNSRSWWRQSGRTDALIHSLDHELEQAKKHHLRNYLGRSTTPERAGF